jgi:hypothetical protein
MQYKFNHKTLKPLPCKTFGILQCVYTVKLRKGIHLMAIGQEANLADILERIMP